MVPTRRQALGGVASLLAALAGCSSLTDSSPPVDSDDANRFERPENVAMDPPTVKLRRSGSRDPIVEVSDSGGELNQTERERRQSVREGFVTSRDDASLLQVTDVDGAQSARQFVEDTDFDTEFLFVDRGSVRQCYEQVLCYVAWSEFEFRRTYASVYRDYDVTCSTDERDRFALFIRLDGSIDTRKLEDRGTLTRRNGCPVPRWQRDNRDDGGTETNTTNARVKEWVQ